jgi:hypothetical protein
MVGKIIACRERTAGLPGRAQKRADRFAPRVLQRRRIDLALLRHAAHHHQRHQHRGVRHGVDPIHVADAGPGDDQPAQGRTGDRPELEGDRVQAEGVGQVPTLDQVRDEGLAGGHVEGGDAGTEGGDGVDRPQGGCPGHRQPSQQGRQHSQRRLGEEHQPSAVDRVGGDAGDQREHQDREDVGQTHGAQRDRLGIDLVNVPQHRGSLHPGAGNRNQQPDPQKPVAAMAQGGRESHAGECAPTTAEKR